ncbi:MAG: hypothetical protein M1838_003253, partial [Thelocarpon superellum]
MTPSSSWVVARLEGSTPVALLEFMAGREVHDGETEANGERPRKRPRHSSPAPPVETNGHDKPNEHEDENKHIAVARRDVILTFADHATNLEHLRHDSFWEENQDRPVQMKASVTSRPSSLTRFALLNMDGQSLVDTTAPIRTFPQPNLMLDDLRWATSLINLSNRRGTSGAASGIARAAFALAGPRDKRQGCYRLRLTIEWRAMRSYADQEVEVGSILSTAFDRAFPPPDVDLQAPWSPQDFYSSVFVPAKDQAIPSAVQSERLECQLYPFQRRAVRWLLRREGVDLDAAGVLVQFDAPAHQGPPPSFRPVQVQGQSCFISNLFSIVAPSLEGFQAHNSGRRGGILAEEMGLGKTVEMIALLCLHRRESSVRNITTSGRPSNATLIITPSSILEQWKTELHTHAPSLNVLHYEGLKTGLGKLGDEELVEMLAGQDVVLTTYNVLASEVHYAGPTKERDLRHRKKYLPRRSPLVQIEWWRVCLDEAQMVESGVSNAAIVARSIPRCNAWAVSGTPVRKDVKDLFGLLIFLHYEPYCHSARVWEKLVTFDRPTLQDIFGQIALRHTKEQLRDELQLPPQKRVVITVPFTPVEEQHYAHIFQQMCDDCGLDLEGAPLHDNWNPDEPGTIEKMRRWLTRLRQTCLHPEVGGQNRRALGHKDGPLRTVAEVLEVMINQTESLTRTEERSYLQSKLRRGQILEDAGRTHEALALWLEALRESEGIVQECRTQLQEEVAKAGTLPGKPMAAAGNSETEESDSGTEEDRRGDGDTRLGALRLRLRSALEVYHVCLFFVGNANFQIKSNEEWTKPESDEFRDREAAEVAYYERARVIRAEMLSEVAGKAGKLMKKLGRRAATQSFVILPEVVPSSQLAGIESRTLAEKLQLVGAALNDQANLLDEWREKVVQLLVRPLVDKEEDAELQGDEYDISTKQQDEVYVYMEALNAVVADRHDALTGQTNRLIAEEVMRAKGKANRGEGHAPELMKELLELRSQVKPPNELGSIRAIVTELRGLATALSGPAESGDARAGLELQLVEVELRRVQRVSSEQSKAMADLEREMDFFRGTSNARLEYYKQLQQVSDTVEPYQNQSGEPDEVVLERMRTNEAKMEAKVSSSKAKRRYLIHLRSETTDRQEPRICVICQQSFEIGALTVCGHQYCKECMRLWWSEHRSCPICKKHLKSTDFHQITYKPQELLIQEDVESGRVEQDAASVAPSIYSGIGHSTLTQIKNIDLDGSFGTKIDTLTRHLLWIRENDAGAKSIVFSQYRDFLDVLARAFSHSKIGFTAIDRKGGIDKFKSDPSVECFLLHARAHASGLNLVNATHVFLCEPLINTALELQAIARVHRIGQHRPTTVWMYLVTDTVEESIYEISVSRRLAHMGGEPRGPKEPNVDAMERRIDAANSLTLQEAPLARLLMKTPGGGEMVQKDDLWRCLFGNRRRRLRRANELELDPEIGRHLRASAAERRT